MTFRPAENGQRELVAYCANPACGTATGPTKLDRQFQSPDGDGRYNPSAESLLAANGWVLGPDGAEYCGALCRRQVERAREYNRPPVPVLQLNDASYQRGRQGRKP